MNNTQSIKYIILILTICLFARSFLFVLITPWNPTIEDQVILHKDPVVYHKLAINIIRHQQFAIEKDGPPLDFRTPAYPLFIGFLYTIFGEKPWIVILFQIALDSISCILLFDILKRFLNIKIALFASLFYALDPFLTLYSNTLYSDTLFVFCCVISYYFLSKAFLNKFQRGTLISIIFSALFFGIATLVRPIALYLTIAIAVMLLLFLHMDLKKAARFTIVFISVFTLVISPWLIRNYLTFNAFSLSTLGPLNLLVSYIAPMEMERRGQSYEVVTESLLSESDRLVAQDGFSPDELNPFEKGKYWQTLAIKYAKDYPISFIKHYVLGIFHSFANLNTRTFSDMLPLVDISDETFNIKAHPNILDLIKQWSQHKTPAEKQIAIIIGVYLLVSYAFLGIGLITAWKTYDRTFFLLSLSMAAYFILVTGTAGKARLKMPSIPFYLCFVGIGVSYITSGISKRFKNHQDIRHEASERAISHYP